MAPRSIDTDLVPPPNQRGNPSPLEVVVSANVAKEVGGMTGVTYSSVDKHPEDKNGLLMVPNYPMGRALLDLDILEKASLERSPPLEKASSSASESPVQRDPLFRSTVKLCSGDPNAAAAKLVAIQKINDSLKKDLEEYKSSHEKMMDALAYQELLESC